MKFRFIICVAIIFLILCSLVVPVLAHPGGTDSSGGHHDTSTGEYHYHHGYPAHFHTNGKCPYQQNTSTNSPSYSSNSSNNSNSDDFTFGDFLLGVLFVAVIIVFVIIVKRLLD